MPLREYITVRMYVCTAVCSGRLDPDPDLGGKKLPIKMALAIARAI
jgi:hypothetical protein